ncbi:MAG: hypothetical protein IJB02_06340 [Oscillospiraceae bacterium]|nr:hypothetical protein [Oscillospiraceae bacterium]
MATAITPFSKARGTYACKISLYIITHFSLQINEKNKALQFILFFPNTEKEEG